MLFFNSHKFSYRHNSIPKAEIKLKQIKALSKQHAIGVDYNNNLWELSMGTWTWVKNNVKTATINYNGEIFYIDSSNLIYKLNKN